MSIVGTLVVKFGESAVSESGSIIAEWDDTLNLDAEGEVKSQFLPGDVLSLLVHHDRDVVVKEVIATGGSIASVGKVTLPRDKVLGFGSAEDEQGLDYNPAPAGQVKYDWHGRVGVPVRDGKLVHVRSGWPCLAVVSYSAVFMRYQLHTPGMTLAIDDTWPFRVYVYYEEAE